MKMFLVGLFAWLVLSPSTAHAIVNPLEVPNNKVGIHIMQATPDESSPAASLVNNNGDWGYVTILIEKTDKNKEKWQGFFDDLRRKHLIPIVRIATKPSGNFWDRPSDTDAKEWAQFLDSLNWPTKNRYVTIYNEPNHSNEWGNSTDPISYAKILNETIDALKATSNDFFVLNAGFDASAPHQPPRYFDQLFFMQEMEKTVPGIFKKLDGWVSHSYPNPGFVGSPDATGRISVKGWVWELDQLRNFGVTKNLPVFITETGWKHAEGLILDRNLPSADIVASYYEKAFKEAWISPRIVAVTPFLLTYQEASFDHFSFKKLGADYYPQFQVIKDLPKVSGKPIQVNRAELVKGEVFKTVVARESYDITLTFKNTGGSIWADGETIKLKALTGGSELGIPELMVTEKVEPGQEYTFKFRIKAPEKGIVKTTLNLFSGNTQFESPAVEFTTEVKSPVIIQVKTSLKWKKIVEGDYLLMVEGAVGQSAQKVYINKSGVSEELDAKFLLPDYAFDFTLQKPFYQGKSINQTLHSGVNILDFGELEPDFASVFFNPKEFWKLLPFTN
jgi:hypothetical protein